MSYNDPKQNSKRGPKPKGRKPWTISMDPAVQKGIEKAAQKKGMRPSDFLNDHFSYLAADENNNSTEKQ